MYVCDDACLKGSILKISIGSCKFMQVAIFFANTFVCTYVMTDLYLPNIAEN